MNVHIHQVFLILKRYKNAIGVVFGMLGIVYVGNELSKVPLTSIHEKYYLPLAVSTILFMLLGVVVGASWWSILKHLKVDAKLLWGITCFGYSQIGKYLPGNIFHLASRQLLATANDISQKKAGASQILELSLLGISATIFVSPLVTTLPLVPSIDYQKIPIFWLGTIIMFSILIIYRLYWILIACFGYYIYFLLSGYMFHWFLTLNPMSSSLDISISKTISVFALAWLVGTFTPGSPAGLGIREAIIISLLQSQVDGAEIALAAVVMRISNIIGDLGLYLISHIYTQIKPRLVD